MAISGEVEVYNLALNAVGARSNVSLPTESSREAEVCRLWFSPVRDQLLASAPWPEATDIRYLSELAEASDDAWVYDNPRPGYTFVYALPSDYIRANYMTDFSRFLITSHGNSQRAIHTNMAQAALVYTKRLEDISLMSPDLQMALVYGLASHICMPITGKPSRAKSLLQIANQYSLEAREQAANASNETQESIPDWIAARGYNFSSGTRYFYPYGSLLSLANVN